MEQVLRPVEEKLGELKREIIHLRRLKLCPFYSIFGNEIKCTYKDKHNRCYDIEVAPGNSDAWCTRRINISRVVCI